MKWVWCALAVFTTLTPCCIPAANSTFSFPRFEQQFGQWSWEMNSTRRRRLQPESALPSEKPRPFIVLFTTSVGSSWLMQELQTNPAICVIGHEPLDDFCSQGKSSGKGKQQLNWLRVAMSPPELDEFSEHMGRRMARGDGWRAAWRLWKVSLLQHALPCRTEEVVAREFFSCVMCFLLLLVRMERAVFSSPRFSSEI